MKNNLDLDNSDFLQAVGQASNALKPLYQQLAQIKSAISDIVSAIGGIGGGSKGPQYIGGSSANSTASVGSGINLAGAGLSGGGLGIAALLGLQGASNAVASINPSIAQANNQSVASVLAAGNPIVNHFTGVGVSRQTSRMFHAVMGDMRTAFDMGYSPADYGAGVGQYAASRSVAYQGAVGNAAFDDVLSRWNFSGGGLQERGFSGASYDQLGALRQTAQASVQSQIASGRLAIGSTLAYGVGQVANQYAQYVASGQQNPLGFANTYGSIAGGVAGAFAAGAAGFGSAAAAGAAAGSVIPGFGTLAGAAIGSIIGGGLSSAAISPFVATREAQKIGAVTSVQLGINSNSFAGATHEASAELNEGFASNNGTLNGLKDRFLRATHLYAGNDIVSQQDVAQTFTSLYSANLNNGTDLSFGQLRTAGQRFIDRYKGDSADIAQRLAPALSKARANGNNLADLVGAAGLDSTILFARDRGDNAGAASLARGYGRTLDAQYQFEGAQSIAQGAVANYAASSLGGRSGIQRRGAFESAQSALQGEIGAVDAQISAQNALPGGANSAKNKALNALKNQLYEQITSIAEGQAGIVLGDAFGVGGVGISRANISLTRANLYGNAGSFAGAGRELLGALGSEASGIRASLSDPNLSYSDKLRGQQRLNEIASQRIQVPASVAGSTFRRNILGADVAAGQAGYAYNVAGAYGSDTDLGNAALGGINSQQSIIAAANRALADPNLSVEDRAAAQQRITGAQNSQLQLRIGSRDTLLGRIAGRASVSQGAAGLALTRASVLGTGSDLRAASAGAIGAYGDEQKQIAAQLSAGGLTVEQEIRLKQRQNSLSGEIFNTQQSAIDSGNAKDDLTGYITPQRKIQGQLERLQYLPFSASSPVKLSIQEIGLNNKQLGVLNSREEELRKGGNLSPERQDALEAARQSIYTQNAAAVSTISEGFLDRLPALSAGRPSFGAKFTSFSAAAANLSLMGGNPIRSFGAVSGAQLRTQDDYIRAAGGTPEQIAPHSRMSALDNGGNAETNDLLRQIVQILGGSTGNAATSGGLRRGEQLGGAQANLSSRDLGQRGAAGNRN